MQSDQLPHDFVDLAKFSEWVLPNETARAAHRRKQTFAHLQDFYQGMKPRIEAALNYLDTGFELDTMPEAEQTLFKICLSFAEVAPFIEQYGRTVVPEAFDETRFVPQHDIEQNRAGVR